MVSRALRLVLLSYLVLGCEKEERPSKSEEAAAPPAAPAMDPDLAQAVAAASAAPPPGNGPGAGPPPNGIFPPGAADKEVAAGQPPKLSLGSNGAEPRVSLQPAQPKPGAKYAATLQVALKNDPRQGALPIDFGITFEAQKPKGEEGMVTEVPVVVRVTSARIGISGAPKELEDSIAKLKGSKVEYLSLPGGGATGFRFELAKGTSAELGDTVRALSDTLAAMILPLPKEPVGVGAYWMATSRDGLLGLDLVTYRLVKVESVEAAKVTLSVNTKRYSANGTLDLPGLPADAPRTMAEFQSMSEGKVELVPGNGFPSTATESSVLGASLGRADSPDERGTLEVRTRGELRPAAAPR